MAKEPLRKAIKEHEIDLTYTRGFQEVLQGVQSYIAAAIISAAMVEKALLTLLSKYLRHCKESDALFEIGGDLDGFSKCIRMAYCLGLIPNSLKRNLQTIAKVRNTFAHSDRTIDFSDNKIVALCMSGFVLPKGFTNMPKELEIGLQNASGPHPDKQDEVAGQYVGFCLLAFMALSITSGLTKPVEEFKNPAVFWD
jgi:hypothetical protein